MPEPQRRWRIMDGLKRCIITHEGHTVMCASAADARIIVESVNTIIEAMGTDRVWRYPSEARQEDDQPRMAELHLEEDVRHA